MLAIFYGLAVALIGLAGALAGAEGLFWLGLAAFAAHLAWQIVRLDINDPDVCLAVFKSDRDAGLILFAGIVADALWRGWGGVCWGGFGPPPRCPAVDVVPAATKTRP